MKTILFILGVFSLFLIACGQKQTTNSENETTAEVGKYKIVDTNQQKFFDNRTEIEAPALGESFFGQDAEYEGNKPSYLDNGDGTVTDQVTGLIWQKAYEVMSYSEAVKKVKTFNLANRTDWRIPSIKEAYSLIQYSGVDVSSKEMSLLPQMSRPFIDTTYFDFKYGSNGQRVIDVQLLSSTVYQGTTLGGALTVFGVNLADGRIKGYPVSGPEMSGAGGNNRPPRPASPDSSILIPDGENPGRPMGAPGGGRPGMPGEGKFYTVRYVCGNTAYGKNNYSDNHDGSISDLATSLMWSKDDSKIGMNWEEALAYAANKNKERYLGHNDWRLPNAKELHSILDYSRSPQMTKSAAINPLFEVTEINDELGKTDYPFFWSSTTHENQQGGDFAVYLCFGEALGFMKEPWSDEASLMDVHGAGAQRSDPKAGYVEEFPRGQGPQGDVIRINNFVRLVRDIH